MAKEFNEGERVRWNGKEGTIMSTGEDDKYVYFRVDGEQGVKVVSAGTAQHVLEKQ